MLYLLLLVKRAIAFIVSILLLVGSFQFFSLASANTVPYPSKPNQELPTIEVYSPKDGEVFNVTSVVLNFNVTKPESWDYYWMHLPVIGTYHVLVILDGKAILSKFEDEFNRNLEESLTQSISSNFAELTGGNHTAEVVVTAYAHYSNPSPDHSKYLQDIRNISKTVNFMVNADLPTPTPTIEPETEVAPFPIIEVVSVAVIVAVFVAGLAVYHGKHRR